VVPVVQTTTDVAGFNSTEDQVLAVAYYVSTEPSYLARVFAGEEIKVVADFRLNACQQEGNAYRDCVEQGSEAYVGVQVRVCVSPHQPCQPGDEWVPLDQARLEFAYPVDWIGMRDFWVVAEFRDMEGERIFAIQDFYVEREAEMQMSASVPVEGILDDRTPVSELPPPVQTQLAPTQEAYPVLGNVEIEGGSCCAGGTAGETIEIRAAFETSSQYGEVTEMRTTTGCLAEGVEEAVGGAPWEPFQPEKTYQVELAINWVGFCVNVQFRDSQGNTSRVYTDDISLEGMP
jgi:hypothetical protein